MAAIYLDGGLEAARIFILRHMMPEIELEAAGAMGSNHKSLLQQVACAASLQRNAPAYDLLDEQGPDHHKCFKRWRPLLANGHSQQPGAGPEKEAEQLAAMNALAQVNGEPIPNEAD